MHFCEHNIYEHKYYFLQQNYYYRHKSNSERTIYLYFYNFLLEIIKFSLFQLSLKKVPNFFYKSNLIDKLSMLIFRYFIITKFLV